MLKGPRSSSSLIGAAMNLARMSGHPLAPMRKRFLIVAGVIAGVLALVICSKQDDGVSAASLGITNFSGQTFCLLSTSNGTERLINFTAWPEWSLDGKRWSRETLHNYNLTLRPMADATSFIVLPTPGKHRIALIYGVAEDEQHWRYWLGYVRTLLGLKPSTGNRLHVEVE
jgi:hypothetical protein